MSFSEKSIKPIQMTANFGPRKLSIGFYRISARTSHVKLCPNEP
jgi:hypothetical protein